MEKNIKVLQRLAYVLMILIMSYVILTHMKNILYPIALALLFSYLLFPLVNFFETILKLPRTLAILVSILLGISLISMVTNLFIIQVGIFISDFPVFKDQAIENLIKLQTFIENKFHFSVEEQEIWVQDQLNLILDSSGEFLKTIARGATATIETIIFIPIFSFFNFKSNNKIYGGSNNCGFNFGNNSFNCSKYNWC